jgi:hypothetical protein
MPFDIETATPVDKNNTVSNNFDIATARPFMPDEKVNIPHSVPLTDMMVADKDRRKSVEQYVAESESFDKAMMKSLEGEPPTPISVMHDAMNEFAKLTKGPVTLMKALPPVAEWNFIAGLARSMTPENIQDPQALLLGAVKNVGIGDPDVVEPLIKSLDIKNPNGAALLSLLPSAMQFETLTNGLGGKILFGSPTEELNPAPLTVRENIAKDLLADVQRARQDGLEGAKAFFQVNTPEKVYGDIKDLFAQGKLQLLDYPDVETASKDLTQRIYSHWQTSLYQARIAQTVPRLQSAFKLLTGEEGSMYIPDTKAINIAKQILAGEPAEFPAGTLESILKASGSPVTSAVVKIGEKTYTGASHEEALNKAGLSKDEAIEGTDFEALFRTAKGEDITREEAKKEYGIERSTDLHKQAAQEIINVSKKLKTAGKLFSADPDDAIYREYLKNVSEDEKLDYGIEEFEKQTTKDLERDVNDLLRAAGKPSVMSKNDVKAIIREETGQVSAGDLVSEKEALKARLQAQDESGKDLRHTIETFVDREIERDKINAADREKVIKQLLKERKKSIKEAYKSGKAEGREKEQIKTAEQKLREKVRKDAATEVKKLAGAINNLNTSNLPLDYQDMIEALKSKYDLSKRTQKTLAKREGMKSFVERQREAGETINIPDEQLDLLDKTSLNDMTLDDLREVHDTIMRLYKLAKLKDKLLTAMKDRKFAEIVKEGVETITKGKGLTEQDTLVKALRKQDESLAKMSLNNLQYFMKVNLRPEVMMNQMDSWDVRGICSQVCWDNMEDADETHSLNKDVSTAMLEQIFEGISPKEIHKKYNVGRFKGITKDNMFKIYVHSFNPDGMNYLEGSGVTEKDIKDISDFLSDKEKKAMDELFDFMDNYMWPRISEVYEDVEGAHLGKVDHYFPIMRTEGVQYEKELEKEILEARYARRPGIQKGFTKERSGVSKRSFSDFSFFKDLSSHIDKVEHYIAFARAVRDARKFLYAPEIKAAISQKYGEDYYKILDKWLKDTAYGKLSRTDEFWSNVLQASRRQFAPAVLSFNLLTTAKQVLGFFPGMEYAGKSSTLMFTAKYIANPIKTTKMVKAKSVMMRFRNMRQEREFEELASKWGSLEKIGHMSGWNKVQQMGLYLTLGVDRVISTCVWGGAYENSISKGMDEESAIREANRVTRRTQPMGGLIHLPDLFRGSEAQRQITFLRGHTNKFLNLQYEMVAKKKNGASSNGKFMSQLLFFSLIPAVGFFWIEKKRLPKNVQEWLGAVGRQTTISLWLVENMFSYFATGFFSSDTPIESYLNDLAKIFRAKKIGMKVEKAIEFTGEVAGAPVVGVRRALKGEWFGKPEKREKADKAYAENFG